MSSFLLKNVRFAQCFVFNPSEKSGKYSCRVLIDKDNKEDIETLSKALQECKEDKKTLATFGGNIPAKFDNVIRDGDEEFPGDPVYKNKIFFNSSNTDKPEIINVKGEHVDEDEFYSGCWGAFNGRYFAYNKAGRKGFSISLDNLLKLRDDEKLSGGVSAKRVFADMLQDDSNPFKGML